MWIVLSHESRAALLRSRGLWFNLVHDAFVCGRLWIRRLAHIIMNRIQEAFQAWVKCLCILRYSLQYEIKFLRFLRSHSHAWYNVSTQWNERPLLLLLQSQFVSRTENVFQQVLLWDLKFILTFIHVFFIVCAISIHVLPMWIWKCERHIAWDTDFWDWTYQLAVVILERWMVFIVINLFRSIIYFILFRGRGTSAVVFLQDLFSFSFGLNVESVANFAC